jgi:hypothetical protein
MPCLLAILAVAFPRVAIVLLWLFTNFFSGLYRDWVLPVLGFLFLPLTLIVYSYLSNVHKGVRGTTDLVILFVAVILDLGLVGGGTFRRRSVA